MIFPLTRSSSSVIFDAGIAGPVSAGNSLTGAYPLEMFGSDGVTALSTGNYVIDDSGSVTWESGAASVSGIPSPSLVSTLGIFPSIVTFPGGDYVASFTSGTGLITAFTWGDGTNGSTVDGETVGSFCENLWNGARNPVE